MIVPFEQLSPSSRLWIYSSKTAFSEEQKHIIKEELESFIVTWEAHGASLKASYKIEHEHFIILAVDENYHEASGCSIDKSVQVIRNIESRAKVDLMDRLAIFVWDNNNVRVLNAGGIKEMIKSNLLTSDTQVFDNSITNLNDYQYLRLKSAGNTWLKRYFNSVLQ
jgi:hypothetical protein